MKNFEKMKLATIDEVAKMLEQRWFGNSDEVKKWLDEEDGTKIDCLDKDKVSKLKSSVFTLLYDRHGFTALSVQDADDSYIKAITAVLVAENSNICPYKNYDCTDLCLNIEDCGKGSSCIDCDGVPEEIWNNFISTQDVF